MFCAAQFQALSTHAANSQRTMERDDMAIDEARTSKVIELWATVFKASNECLRQATTYGFDAMHQASPNIHEIVQGLVILEAAIGAVLADPQLDWEHQRHLHNAKEQLARMSRLAAALQADDRDAFDTTLALLEKQAVC
ncbi:hypothetical protein PEC18_18650 [Paucibacter sp. O1-1]|nr:hypothetical protein [Paucibacter sp. O1-1]MDA3827818.1 hypothetical protein [Paucibacter sp. O1-1]